ncbi:DedA family protein [Streptomyces sp. NPDC002845]
MQIEVGALYLEPELVTVVALAAVLGDALLPFLPSGSLVIAASLLALDHGMAPLALVLAVAVASFLGDLALVALVGSGSGRADALLARHAGVASTTRWLQNTLDGQLGRMTVAARFVPAGRTVLGMALGSTPAVRARYLSWSAVGSLVWACYLVGLGALNGLWFEARWVGFAVSTAAAVTISTCLARAVRQRSAATGRPSLSPRPGRPDDTPCRVAAEALGELPGAGVPAPRPAVPPRAVRPLLQEVPEQRVGCRHRRFRPASAAVDVDVARKRPRGDTLGPFPRHQPVRANPLTAQDPVGGDPPVTRAHPGRDRHDQKRCPEARPQHGPGGAQSATALALVSAGSASPTSAPSAAAPSAAAPRMPRRDVRRGGHQPCTQPYTRTVVAS